jgi:hypothetical protein
MALVVEVDSILEAAVVVVVAAAARTENSHIAFVQTREVADED